jgi:transcriptional regulator with XRE-family HTH domain
MEESIVERVLILIKEYGLTASEFADKIDVQRSSMSHLVSGRNKPSLDFIQKILNNFSDINPTWLIMGTGPMKQLDLFDIKGDVAPIQPIPAENFRTEPSVAEHKVIKSSVEVAVPAAEDKKVVYAQSVPTLSVIPEQIAGLPHSEPVPVIAGAPIAASAPPADAVPVPVVPVVAVSQPAVTIAPAAVQEVPVNAPNSPVEASSQAEKSVQNDKKVVKIVFFYSDNTFETFNPQ